MSERGGDAKKAKWPVIKPKRDLQITRLRDTHLFTIQNFFTSAESKAFIKAAESIGFVHQGSQGPAKGEAYRDNDRISVNDPVLAESIWESGLRNFFSDIKIRGKVAVGLNPNLRFYRYKVGQRFGRHIDESVDLGDGCRTYYTLLIYLSGGVKHKGNSHLGTNQDYSEESLVGGETVFYDSRRGIVAEVAPVEGMALLHIHGDKFLELYQSSKIGFIKHLYPWRKEDAESNIKTNCLTIIQTLLGGDQRKADTAYPPLIGDYEDLGFENTATHSRGGSPRRVFYLYLYRRNEAH
ncbi:hypothetical protein NE237_013264 [Protea cynaroides]|uniref:Prolyl 4-hydroxylase alpha subunit domain-containing protein n=1 Tax=Protea cynaroides TaxID=273540 RepID=A0A9Q0GYD1_9MAGN|nr:hypothetical protein NE237_013264 [Protea cynaroides]